ncbi:MAG TPA: YhdP family protein [Steroidobacteraceae bacterium]|nr:YhdP family protein [Steroidobacteraceae bacterium]
MRLRKFGKILLYCAAGLLILALALMLGVKLALDRVPEYQEELKAWVHQQTGLHIRFAHVAPSFRWSGPELYFDELELRSKDDARVLARAAGGRIGTDLWQLVRSGKLLAGRVELDSPEFSITRLGPNNFALASEIELGESGTPNSALTLDDLPAGNLIVRNGRLVVQRWNAALPELILDRVNVNLRRDGGGASLVFSASLPRRLGGELNLTATAQGLSDPDSVVWSIDLSPKDVAFQGWRLLLPEYLDNLSAGKGAFRLSASGQGRSLTRAALDFGAEGVVTHLGDGTETKFDEISGMMTLTHIADRWSVFGRRLSALRAGIKDPMAQFDVTWRAATGGLIELHADANYLRAETLLPLTGLLPQKDLRDRLAEVAPSGEWSDAHLDLQRAEATDPWDLLVRAKFRDFGFAPVGRAPGLRGLTGEIAGDQSGGHVDIEIKSGHFVWPQQFPRPVDIETAKAIFYWKRTADALLIATPGLAVKNADAQLSARVALQLPSNGDSPLLTLVSQLDNGVVSNARNYLPRAQIAPKTVEWLDQALVAGRMSHADVLLRGPLWHFPFRDGSGIFLARAKLEGLTLAYQAGWPQLESLAGRVEFRNEGMSAQLSAGAAGGVKLENGDAQFPDFKSGELTIHASAAGDADAAVKFLRATPLDDMSGKVFSSIEAAGPFRSEIELFLPFRDFDSRRVLIHGHADGATLHRPGLPLNATEIAGDFDIDGAQLARADLRGRLLGGAFRALARSPKARPLTRSQIDLRGTLSGDALRAAMGLPAARAGIQGLSDWHAVVKLAPEPARERSVHVTGSLSGLDIRLPQPLAKPYGTPMPSWLDIQWPSSGGTQVNLGLGSILHAVFALESDPDTGESRLARAAIQFGDGDPTFSDSQILNVGGSLTRFDLTGWLRVFAPDSGGMPLSYYLRSAKLEIGEVDFIGLVFRSVALDLGASADRWRLGLDGPNLAGTIMMPMAADSADFWELQFDRVNVDDQASTAKTVAPAATAADAAEAAAISPRAVPAMHFSASDVTWDRIDLGNLQGTVSKHDDGITLDQLTATNPSFTVKAQGEWRGKGAGLGHVQGSLASTDVQATLAQLGYAGVISAKTGQVDFDLHWLGAPSADAMRETTGHVKVALDKGQLLSVKPGAGRVLGLASIAALPRRLFGDFSDVTDKGLAFDTARGDFDFHGGNAYTDNVLIKGPAAEIGLIGRIGLKGKDYDETAVVTGSISNTFPIAGALAGGPVVGAAVLLFTQVFKQPLNGLTRAYYRITGGWDNPTIERINSAGAAAASAAATAAEAPKETNTTR